MKQSELARLADISASYLNLIEHNRRRIAGKTLNRLAEVLDVPVATLSEGAEAQLLAALREAAGRNTETFDAEIEVARTEEFAGRFPGWAQLLAQLAEQRQKLEATVVALSERMAHDPQLAASLHEVISTVTSIRSTATILAETKPLEPEWQDRFHRNINEDSSRLADEAQELVRYLDGPASDEIELRSPRDELHSFLAAHAFHFHELEGTGGAGRVHAVIDRATELGTRSAQHLARTVLEQYVQDARRLPMDEMVSLIERFGTDPIALATETGAGMACVFRRLASLPEQIVGPVGLLICDATGTILLRKSILGFHVPSATAGCALWPLYGVLGQPSVPLRARLLQQETRVLALAISEEVVPARFDASAIWRPHMLLLPDPGDRGAHAATEVGSHCQICNLPDCAARREPSILATGF